MTLTRGRHTWSTGRLRHRSAGTTFPSKIAYQTALVFARSRACRGRTAWRWLASAVSTWVTTYRPCFASSGALPAAPALIRARAAGSVHRGARGISGPPPKVLGDGPGTRALVEILLLHRHLGHGDMLAGITAALAVGSVSPMW